MTIQQSEYQAMQSLPPTLLDLLANTLILDSTLPYLPLQSLVRLAKTSHSFHDLVFENKNIFRYVDLSRCRGAYISTNLLRPIDSGGQTFRSQRMDENLTEDEFHSGPLRGTLTGLRRMGVLAGVKTLVLDGLASVTVDLVSEVIRADGYGYDVRLLSVLGCVNLNQRKLQQLLVYVCRPGRPEGTPRVKGLYVLGSPDNKVWEKANVIQALVNGGILSSEGATLGGLPVNGCEVGGSSRHMEIDPWYAPTGRVVHEGYSRRSPWQETLSACRGIIAFDGVLCNSMHHAMEPYWHEASRDFLTQHNAGVLPLASVALGPAGCASCGQAPPRTPIWGESELAEFPLLRPPPWSGRVEDAVRPPKECEKGGKRKFIAACTWCLANRHCEKCHRWWCGQCYDPKQSRKLADLERLSNAGLDYLPARDELSFAGSNFGRLRGGEGDSVKVFNGLCVENCLVGEMMAGAGSGGMWG